jgi:hypothetical protein
MASNRERGQGSSWAVAPVEEEEKKRSRQFYYLGGRVRNFKDFTRKCLKFKIFTVSVNTTIL